MQILRRYNFNETEKIGLLSIQQLGEVYISLKEEQNFLREPYSLVKNLEKIDFYEKENRESIEKYLESICECHQFLKEYKSLIQQFSNRNFEDFKEFFLRHTPIRRMGQPEEIAAAVVYFASDESAFTTGQILTVSGGFGLATPVFGDLAERKERR